MAFRFDPRQIAQMSKRAHLSRRRVLQALGLGAVGLWVWGAPRLPDWWQPAPEFTPIEGAAPFRRLQGTGALTSGNVALIGLDPAPSNPALAQVRADPCSALFRGAAGPAIAFFSDFNCPNCPAMSANLEQVAADTGTALIRHQLPILGRSSDLASRAVLAADLQGGHDLMYDALTRTPAVRNIALIRRLAAQAGLDDARLAREMVSPDVARRLATSQAVATYLGLIGTPATVIGRSVVLGTLPTRQIRQIIEAERAMGEVC